MTCGGHISKATGMFDPCATALVRQQKSVPPLPKHRGQAPAATGNPSRSPYSSRSRVDILGPPKEVAIGIPFKHGKPSVSSVDQLHITARNADRTFLFVGEENLTGSFEFAAEGDEELDLFPLLQSFTRPDLSFVLT